MFSDHYYNEVIFLLCQKLNWQALWYGYKDKELVCGFIRGSSYSGVFKSFINGGIIKVKIIPENIIWRRILKIDEDIIFFAQLEELLAAKYPIVDALKICAKGNKNPHIRYILLSVAAKVAAGKSFNEALSEFKYHFNPITLGLIKVGELSGTLEETLTTVHNNYNKKYKYSRNIKKTMRYPLIILIISLMIIIFFLFEVIPSFASIFTELGATLNPATENLLFIAETTNKHKLLCLIIIMTTIFYYYCYPYKIKGKNQKQLVKIQHWKHKRMEFQQNFALSLSLMLKQNIVLKECLINLSKNESNIENKKQIIVVVNYIKNGSKFTTACEKAKIFDDKIIMQLAIAEETGNLVVALERTATKLEQDIEYIFEYYCQLLQPLTIIIVGIVIGFMLFVLYTPILTTPLSL